ncbi:MAG: hypothetical protein ACKPDM_25725, partial [Dolichospermum sp.]
MLSLGVFLTIYLEVKTAPSLQQTWDSAPIPQHTFTIFYRRDGAVFTSKYIVKKIPKDNKPVPPQSFIDTVDDEEITI